MEQMITSDPEVMLGKPVIRGTRVTIELILNKLNAGETVEQILDSYPHLHGKEYTPPLSLPPMIREAARVDNYNLHHFLTQSPCPLARP